MAALSVLQTTVLQGTYNFGTSPFAFQSGTSRLALALVGGHDTSSQDRSGATVAHDSVNMTQGDYEQLAYPSWGPGWHLKFAAIYYYEEGDAQLDAGTAYFGGTNVPEDVVCLVLELDNVDTSAGYVFNGSSSNIPAPAITTTTDGEDMSWSLGTDDEYAHDVISLYDTDGTQWLVDVLAVYPNVDDASPTEADQTEQTDTAQGGAGGVRVFVSLREISAGGGPQTILAAIAPETDAALDATTTATGTTTVAADLPSETDAGLDATLTATGAVTAAADLPSETDAALDATTTPSGAATVTADLGAETDAALDATTTATGVATTTADLATETDAALDATTTAGASQVDADLPSETDAALDATLGASGVTTATADLATETDAALDVTMVVNGQATVDAELVQEVDLALEAALNATGAVYKDLDLPSETDAALDATVSVGTATLDLDLPSETDAALDAATTATGTATLDLDLPSETDAALDAVVTTATQSIAADLATEVDAALEGRGLILWTDPRVNQVWNTAGDREECVLHIVFHTGTNYVRSVTTSYTTYSCERVDGEAVDARVRLARTWPPEGATLVYDPGY